MRIKMTEAERKEARRISSTKWRLKNKDYNISYRNSNREKVNSDERKRMNSTYYVYTHTNSKGDLYIGSGNRSRPNRFSNRVKSWVDCFSNDCEVKIVAEFKDKESARELESLMIEEIGLDNLVNQRI